MRLRRANGKSFGPVKVTKGSADNIANLDATDLAAVETAQSITLADVLARADGSEYPTFELGTADNQSRLVKVLGGQPNGDICTLALVVDDERVHATELGTPPILPLPQFPANGTLLAGLNASFGQGVAEPVLRSSWFPTAGAFYYRAEVSYDEGSSWIEIYQGISTILEKVVTLGAADAQSAVAELQNTVDAQFDDLVATVTENSTAIATVEGYAAGKWTAVVTVDSQGRESIASLVLFDDSDSTSSFTVNANNFFVAFPDAAGGDPVPVYTIANVNGTTKSALRGDMLVDGAIITRMVQAGAITAVTIQAGAINTTQLAVNSVDINALIAGAATQRTIASISPGGGASGGSQTVTILSGSAECSISGTFDPGGPPTAYLTLSVDGSPVIAFGYGPMSSATYSWVVTGLSPGSHTFVWDNSGIVINGAQSVVVDLRR